MKEFICIESPNEVDGGMLVREQELIRCKACRWFINKECAIYCLSSAYEETFCSYAEPKEPADAGMV